MKKVRIVGLVILIIVVLILVINAFITLPDQIVRISGMITIIESLLLASAIKRSE